MKLSDIAAPIAAYADGPGAVRYAVCLRSLASFLREFGDRTILELVECKPKLERARASSGCKLVNLIPHLNALENILEASSATDRANAVRLLIKCLSTDSVYLPPMLEALRRALSRGDADVSVREFIDRLNNDIGSDAFEHTLRELSVSNLKREQVVQIAQNVYGGIQKNTSRRAALAYIRKPHDARTNARRGIEASGGRSAA